MKFAVRDPQAAPILPALLRYRWRFPEPTNVISIKPNTLSLLIKGAHNITFKEKKKKKKERKKTKQRNKFNHRLHIVQCNQ